MPKVTLSWELAVGSFLSLTWCLFRGLQHPEPQPAQGPAPPFFRILKFSPFIACRAPRAPVLQGIGFLSRNSSPQGGRWR